MSASDIEATPELASRDSSESPNKSIWLDLRERLRRNGELESNKKLDWTLVSPFIAIAIFVMCSFFSSPLSAPSQIKLGELCAQAISIGGVGFSASLAILAITTAITDSRFRDALTKDGITAGSPYGDLIFYLTIACYVQLGLIITALFFDVVGGERILFAYPLASISNFIGMSMGAFLAGILVLAFSLQLTALRTVRQVTLLYGLFAQVESTTTPFPLVEGGCQDTPPSG
jgi:hypothetical protein